MNGLFKAFIYISPIFPLKMNFSCLIYTYKGHSRKHVCWDHPTWGVFALQWTQWRCVLPCMSCQQLRATFSPLPCCLNVQHFCTERSMGRSSASTFPTVEVSKSWSFTMALVGSFILLRSVTHYNCLLRFLN